MADRQSIEKCKTSRQVHHSSLIPSRRVHPYTPRFLPRSPPATITAESCCCWDMTESECDTCRTCCRGTLIVEAYDVDALRDVSLSLRKPIAFPPPSNRRRRRTHGDRPANRVQPATRLGKAEKSQLDEGQNVAGLRRDRREGGPDARHSKTRDRRGPLPPVASAYSAARDVARTTQAPRPDRRRRRTTRPASAERQFFFDSSICH